MKLEHASMSLSSTEQPKRVSFVMLLSPHTKLEENNKNGNGDSYLLNLYSSNIAFKFSNQFTTASFCPKQLIPPKQNQYYGSNWTENPANIE